MTTHALARRSLRAFRAPYASHACLLLAVAFVAGCRVARPSEIPTDEPWIVAVKSCRLPEWEADVAHFAHHTWFDVKRGDESSWTRVEVLSARSGVCTSPISPFVARHDLRFEGREVRVLETITGERARAAAERIVELGARWSDRYATEYTAWPGPNSNTFASDMAANVDGLSFPLHHNAVGKDYPGWFDAGLTTSKTGVRVDTLPLGFAVGAREGIELHVLQLTFGVSLFPPRLELPFLPEIPWSADVPPRTPPPSDAQHVMTIEDPTAFTYEMRTTLLEPSGTFLFDYESAGAWLAIGVEPRRDANGELREFRVIERRCERVDEIAVSEHVVACGASSTPLIENRVLVDASTGARLERTASGGWAIVLTVTRATEGAGR